MKLTLAVYKRPGETTLDPYSYIHAVGRTEWDGYVRATAFVEVDFPVLSAEETIPHELKALDDMEREVRVEAQQKLDAIHEQRQRVLAITQQPAEAV